MGKSPAMEIVKKYLVFPGKSPNFAVTKRESPKKLEIISLPGASKDSILGGRS